MHASSTFPDQFEVRARECPQNVAVHFRQRDLTYAELADQAARIAGWLAARGLIRGDRVALLLPNSPEYVASYLGVLRAGGIAVALNPEMTAAELESTLAHSSPVAVIAAAACESLLRAALTGRGAAASTGPGTPAPGRRLFIRVGGASSSGPIADFLSASLDEILSSPSLPLPSPPAPDDLAQLIYTSGSAGRPKGVTLSHRNISANCRSILAYLELSPDDGVLVTLPFFYSYGNSLLFTHLAAGGRLILSDNFVFWNSVLDLLESQRATGFSGVPTSFAMLLRKSDFRRRRFEHLRYLTCAGGKLAPAAVEQVRSAVPQARLFLMYGQTEGTARLSTLLPDELDRKPGSIGRGIPGVTLQVLDDDGAPVAPGTTGEITARGENVMQGYWNDPQETAAVLRPEGLRTGDLARIDDEGYIYIVGRKSDMIKSGAYRISPEEIEDVILALDSVASVAVVGLPDEIFGEVPVAFVVPSPGAAPSAEQQILDHCRRHLPRYKLVREVRIVESLPQTASGKIRRSELRRQELARRAAPARDCT